MDWSGHDFGSTAVDPGRTSPERRGGPPPLRSCALDTGETTEDETGELPSPAKPAAPQQAGGAATIVCDGKGGYRVDLRGWAGATCGIEGCVRRHEQSHAADWAKRWPKGCKGKKNGGQIPLGGTGYAAFLKKSECRAYTVELGCVTPLYAAAKKAKKPCAATLKAHLDDTKKQRKSFC